MRSTAAMKHLRSGAMVVLMSELPLPVWADTGIGPHLFKDPSVWVDLLGVVGFSLLGIAAFHLGVALFALLHLALLALLLLGLVQGHYRKRAITTCLVMLLALYAGLWAIVRTPAEPALEQHVATPSLLAPTT